MAVVPERIASPVNANVVLGGCASLSRGGRMLLQVFIERQHGFQGEIELMAEGLPDGVTASPTMVSADARSAALILHASDSAPSTTTPLRVVGKSQIGDLTVYRSARFGIPVWNTDNRRITPPFYRTTRDLVLSVADHLEVVSIQADEERVWETARGGKLQIPLNVIRRSDFKERIVLVPFDVPNEFKPANLEIKPDEKLGVLSLDLKDPKTKPGTYTFYLRADIKSRFLTNQAAVDQATTDQKLAEVKLAEATEAIKLARESSTSSTSFTPPMTIQELEEKTKSLQAIKEGLDRQLAEAKQRNAPVERTYPIISSPITLRIAASPMSITATTVRPLKRVDKSSIEVTLLRKYGYTLATKLRVDVPKQLTGIVIPETTIAAGEDRATLEITTTAESPPGDHELVVRAVGKFNSVDVDATTNLKLRIE
jgi:hypothetical protein